MSRSRVEFVQSQRIAWSAQVLRGARGGMAARRLSHDPHSGALSAVVRVPTGWSSGGAIATDEEILVLAGELRIDGEPLGSHGYAHLPKGAASRIESPAGAVCLWFLDADPEPVPAQDFDPARRVVLDAHAVPYTGNFHPEFPPGAGRKWLFRDPVGGEETWLLGTMPLRHAERQEVHPIVEEMFLLAGEVHGDHGVMRPGAYFWRPPGIAHGPFGTRTGNLYFFRSVGGPLATTYIDGEHRFAWNPPLSQVLPPELESARGETRAVVDWNE